MRQFAIVGLGSFGIRMLEKLAETNAEIIIADRDAEVIERYKEMASTAYIVDAMDDAALKRILPEGLDAVVVDLGEGIEATILVTNSLKKLGVAEIIVRADSEDRGEILSIVGATRVVYPEKEAAARVVPLLVSPSLFSFMPIGKDFVIAEVRVPERYVGMSLIEINLRQKHGVNAIAIRLEGGSEYRYFSADYKLSGQDLLLVAGSERNVLGFSGVASHAERKGLGEIFSGLLKGRGKKG